MSDIAHNNTIGPNGTYILCENNRIKTLDNDFDDENIDQNIWTQIEELKQYPHFEQKSQEWLNQRKERIGGSDSASCLGINPYEPQYRFILKKVTTVPFKADMKIMWWGNATEDVANMLYEYLYNVSVEGYGFLPHKNINFIGASPDGIVGKYKRNKKNLTNYVGRMIEIKSVSKRQINMDPDDKIISNIVPKYYIPQVYQQLETCGLDKCDFFQIKAYQYGSFDEYKSDIIHNINDGKFRGMIIQLIPKNINNPEKEKRLS